MKCGQKDFTATTVKSDGTAEHATDCPRGIYLETPILNDATCESRKARFPTVAPDVSAHLHQKKESSFGSQKRAR